MKAIASSIVVVAGAILIAGGAQVAHSDTRLFVMTVGFLIGAVGLVRWFAADKAP